MLLFFSFSGIPRRMEIASTFQEFCHGTLSALGIGGILTALESAGVACLIPRRSEAF